MLSFFGLDKSKPKNQMMELTEKLPAEYEERMLSASVDCVDGNKASGDACHAVGEYFAVVRGDHVRAREFYARNCHDRHHAASCFNLGRLLLAGRGGDVDEARAMREFRAACDASYGPGCHHLGLLFYKTGDKEQGRETLTKACGLRDAESCYVIGSNLLSSYSSRKENPDAATTTTPGASSSSSSWRERLFWRRSQQSRDVAKATGYLEVACDEGHAPACHNLAVLFKHGDAGVAADETKHRHYADRTHELCKAAGALKGIQVA